VALRFASLRPLHAITPHCCPHCYARRCRRASLGLRRFGGFTLIELLVVISIIIILMGLLFPAFRGVQDQAKRTQAKNDLTQIVTAVNAFYTEYGRYPTAATTDSAAMYGAGNANNATLFNELRGTSVTLNTRQVVFLSPADAKDQNAPRSGIKSSTGEYFDPWGAAYAVAVDADYDNQVANPYGPNAHAGAATIRQGVIAWSIGKDGTLDTDVKAGDDVLSWQ
jgi:type II secretory pathway pseudopilin PulG